MLVAVGPLPSNSVIAYTKLARQQVEQLRADPRAGATLGGGLFERFDAFHAEWEDLAAADTEFVWRRELDGEEVAWVTHGFFRVVEMVIEAGGPPAELREESRPFYLALVTSLLDALERESESQRAFACNLRDCWPLLAD